MLVSDDVSFVLGYAVLFLVCGGVFALMLAALIEEVFGCDEDGEDEA